MSTLAEPRRGEVWMAQLDKRRPVVVLTREPRSCSTGPG